MKDTNLQLIMELESCRNIYDTKEKNKTKNICNLKS